MTNNPLISLGDISAPVSVLIDRISNAVGGIARPGQIVRVAKAEAKAEIIRTKTKIEIDEIQERALQRFVFEETAKQNNIENITAKAVPLISEDANPEDMETDWITNFFDKSRLISDDEMQSLWANLLAGEANSPGTFSKRTINSVYSLNKSDALLFQSFCNFLWDIGPLIYDHENDTFKRHNITFNTLTHLDSIGLITFNPAVGYRKIGFPKKTRLEYFNNYIEIEFDKDKNNEMKSGQVLFTTTGAELSKVCIFQMDNDYFNLTVEKMKSFRNMKIININGTPQIED